MRMLDVLGMPWAIIPEKLEEINRTIDAHLRGEKIDLSGILARTDQVALSGRITPHNDDAPGYLLTPEGVAIIGIDGPIAKQMSLFMFFFGGTTFAAISNSLAAALADPAVKAIILAIDSPGGIVQGTQELAAEIRAAGKQKPLAAWSDGAIASAAYWLGAAAGQVYISGDTIQVGSIGVVMIHRDVSKAEGEMGIKTTEITAGKYKRITSQYRPLTEEGQAVLQSTVDHIYAVFLSEVAADRGVTPEQAHERMGDGRTFIGKQAIAAGLVDGVFTLPALITRLTSGDSMTGATAADASSAPTSNQDNEETIMTIDELRSKHPELAAQLLQEGKAKAEAEAKAKAEAEAKAKADAEAAQAAAATAAAQAASTAASASSDAAAAERKRIQDVAAQSLPGHEALIQTLMYDGHTTGAEAAVQILAAERTKAGASAAAFAADGVPPVAASLMQAGQQPLTPAAATGSDTPLDARLEAEWAASAALQSEFLGSKETFIAFRKAEAAGQVRLFKGTAVDRK